MRRHSTWVLVSVCMCALISLAPTCGVVPSSDILLEGRQAEGERSGVAEPGLPDAPATDSTLPTDMRADDIDADVEPLASAPTLPAFPGAEGFGAASLGGRGPGTIAPRIIPVTTLKDRVLNTSTGQWVAAPGSLRAAVESTGPRFIVFRVSGVIVLDTELSIRNPYIYVAGQTAPVGGIALAHRGITINTHDVVLRHLKLRLYFDPAFDSWGERNADGMLMYRNDWEVDGPDDYVSNVMIDHCSIAWAIDKSFCTWHWVRDFTIQWSIICESSFYGHDYADGFAWLSSTDTGAADDGTLTRGTIHHNLIAHCQSRNPLIAVGNTWDMRNNVVYNWYNILAAEFKSHIDVNFVGNNYLAGLDTSAIQSNRNIIKIPYPAFALLTPRFFLNGNHAPNRLIDHQDEWDIGVTYYLPNNGGTLCSPTLAFCQFLVNSTNFLQQVGLASPAPAPFVSTESASAATARVILSAGNNYPVRDAVDTALVNEVDYVVRTRPFDNGYPQYDPNLRHRGPHFGQFAHVLVFNPQNDSGFACVPRKYRILPGQTIDQAKYELLSQLECTLPGGITLPDDWQQVLADPNTYQWQVTQTVIPDRNTVMGLYPSNEQPALSKDTDGDFIPDTWELVLGSDPLVSDSLRDVDANGYLNIEEYLNRLPGGN